MSLADRKHLPRQPRAAAAPGRLHTYPGPADVAAGQLPRAHHGPQPARQEGACAARPCRSRAPAPPPARARTASRSPGAYTWAAAAAASAPARTGHTHQGQDIAAAEGTPLVAVATGTITGAPTRPAAPGYYLVLDADGENYNYVFMHLQQGSLLVGKGDRVAAGQQIANVGNTGSSEGPHLHFEVWDGPWYDGGHPVDPLPVPEVLGVSRALPRRYHPGLAAR